MDPAVVDDYFIYNALKWFVVIMAGIIGFLFIYFKLKARNKKQSEIPAEVKKKERPPDFLHSGSSPVNVQTEYHYVDENEYRRSNSNPESGRGY